MLGRSGIVIVLVAAVFSTASAILATLFALARLAKRIATDGQIPHQLTDRQFGGVPLFFTILIAFFAIVIQFFGNLHQITTFSSLVFLFVFAVVNYMAYRTDIFEGLKNIIPVLGCIGCAGAMCVLIYDTYLTEPNVLYIVLSISAALLASRLLFTWLHSKYKGRRS